MKGSVINLSNSATLPVLRVTDQGIGNLGAPVVMTGLEILPCWHEAVIMGLGPNNEISKNEFIEAMRARLEAKEPGLGANVDDPEVQKNLEALGEAVFRIATVHAETGSDSSIDHAFWQWVADVDIWLSNLSIWQHGVATAFANWTPTTLAEQNIKTAVTAIPDPGAPPGSAPTRMEGKIK